MKNLKMKASVWIGLCIILTMVFASSAVYAGNNPPPVGFGYVGPAVLAELNFRGPIDGETCDAGGVPGVVLYGEATCKGITFPIEDPGLEVSYEFCNEPFANVNEEELNDWWIGGPGNAHKTWLLNLLPEDCLPNLKDMSELEGLVINVVTNYSEEPPELPLLKKAKVVMLFVHPK
jgi:hypothetical protein